MNGRTVLFGVALSVGVGAALALGGWIRHRTMTLFRGAPHAAASAGHVRGEVAELAYDGKLAPGWEDYGWGPHDLPEAGPAKVRFGGFGGLVLRHDPLPSQYGGVVLRFQAPESYADFLDVRLQAKGRESELPKV